MEKITELLRSIKERLSNPLIFSFIFSWIVLNWQIIVCLIWYDTNQIEKDGYISIFEFIKDKININDSLKHPLYFALGYTILIPFIKNLIRAFYSWTSKWGNKWNLKIIDGGAISVNKYLKLRAHYEKRTKILEEVISKESHYLNENNEVKTESLELKNQLNDLKNKIYEKEQFINKLNDKSILYGEWINHYKNENGEDENESVLFENDGLLINLGFGEKKFKYHITNFYFDYENQKVFFIKELVSDHPDYKDKTKRLLVNELKIKNKDLLVGIENKTIQIEYKRKV